MKHVSIRTLFAVTVASVIGLGPADAQQARPAAAPPMTSGTAATTALSVDELEQVFWLCDWRSMLEALDAGSYAVCAATADELKARRFGGDFDRMLAWWRQNKPAEHARIGAARVSGSN